jgi:hypothetical protein
MLAKGLSEGELYEVGALRAKGRLPEHLLEFVEVVGARGEELGSGMLHVACIA